jgi:CO/xanthine dehydrogenase FAD-binding subunit
MYAAPFDYVRATSWSEAVAQLAEAGEDARVIAGGQSLVPMMMLRIAEPSVLVDIGGAAERTIERSNGTLVVSALARHVDLESSAVAREACPMLAEAAGLIGNVRVRHRGTIGGALAHGEPTAEWPCLAVALGATVHAHGPAGERAIAASDLFVTHLTTSLEPGEVITRIELPVLRPGQGSCFVELARRAGDFAMVEVAALVTLGDDGRFADARVVVGATADRPTDVSSAAAALHGEEPGERLAGEVGRVVADEVEVGPSTHASADYRREMVSVLVKRAVLTAAARARGARQGQGGDAR